MLSTVYVVTFNTYLMDNELNYNLHESTYEVFITKEAAKNYYDSLVSENVNKFPKLTTDVAKENYWSANTNDWHCNSNIEVILEEKEIKG